MISLNILSIRNSSVILGILFNFVQFQDLENEAVFSRNFKDVGAILDHLVDLALKGFLRILSFFIRFEGLENEAVFKQFQGCGNPGPLLVNISLKFGGCYSMVLACGTPTSLQNPQKFRKFCPDKT